MDLGSACPEVLGNQGLSGTAQRWREKEERKFLEGKSRAGRSSWREPGVTATGTWGDSFSWSC